MKGREHLRHLDALTDQVYRDRRPFAIAFELDLWRARERLVKGSETRIYAIVEEAGGFWKFGLGGKPQERLENLQIGNPRRLTLYAHAPGTLALERYIHRVLRRHRIAGEWFAQTPRTLVVAGLIRSVQEQCVDLEDVYDGPAGPEDTIAALTSAVELMHMELRAAPRTAA